MIPLLQHDILLERGQRMLLICKRGSGKTWCMRNLVKNICLHRKIDTVYNFSPSARTNPFDYELDDVNYNLEYTMKDSVIEEILESKQEHIVILEDSLSNRNRESIELLKKLFAKENITLIIAIQYGSGINIDFRNKFHYTMMAKDDSDMSKVSLYRNYCGFISQECFEKHLQTVDE